MMPSFYITRHTTRRLTIGLLATVAVCFYQPALAFLLDEPTDGYQIAIHAQDQPQAFTEMLADLQTTLQARDEPDEDGQYLRYRFEQDRTFILKFLKARGYYDARLDGALDEETKQASFTVYPGTQYTFGAVGMQLEQLPGAKPLPLPERELLQAATGQPASSDKVLEDQQAIDNWMEKQYCLFSHQTTHTAILNKDKKTLDVLYIVAAGPEANFGSLSYQGNETIANDHLARITPVKEGDCFKRSKLTSAKSKLQKSGLLSYVKTDVPEVAPADGKVPVVFEVTESNHRSIKAGVNYSTDIGPGFTAGWEHRNLFGRAEKFTADLSVTPIEQLLDFNFTKPFFLRDDQTLKLGTKLKREDNDAYTTSGFTVSGGVDRSLGNDWKAGVGASYGFERIKDQNSTEDTAILSFPVFAWQDKRDDPLDPHKGWTIKLNTAPAIDTLGGGTSYLKSSATGSFFYTIPVQSEPVIALRAATGAITGASTDDVPATKRFYSGGGGSVRGYGYQLAGPLDAENDPLGGRSFLEFSTELRFRVYEEYGFVTFLDGGSAFNSAYPDFEEDLLFGAGIGLRYYTSFGPLRADIAIPLDKREGIDDSFQLYFSIGQAF